MTIVVVVEGGEAAAVAAAAVRLVGGGGGRAPRRSGRLGVDLYRAVAAQAALLVSLGQDRQTERRRTLFETVFQHFTFLQNKLSVFTKIKI
jgi:hypothetical protein